MNRAWTQRNITTDTPFIRLGVTEFAKVPAEPIEFVVLEQCPGSSQPISMVRLDAGWKDLGAWQALWKVLPKDDCNNALVGDVLHTGCFNTLVYATSLLASLVGVKDLLVVETPDAELVADKTNSQAINLFVGQLGVQQRKEKNTQRKKHRPWGWCDSIDEGKRFKVKRIQVNPKARLSLQKHLHHAEHLIVVKGTAENIIYEKVMLLTENQSAFIPLGEVHRLANPGFIPLEIIEIQSGSYFGEDNIIRLDDKYGRTSKGDKL